MPYEKFSQFYDELTSDIDYAERAGYYTKLFARHKLKPDIVLDLACGTGSLSIELAVAGYDVIGIDRSPEMLSVASQKAGSINSRALFICQDMLSLDLYGTIDAAICHLDGINHLNGPKAVQTVFDRVSLFLESGGLFIFDLNTPYKLESVLGNNTFVYDYDNVYCVWQNRYKPKTHTCGFDLTFFEPSGDKYNRYDERFAEKAYTSGQIGQMLEKSGLVLEAWYDGFSFDAANEKSERIIYVARKGN